MPVDREAERAVGRSTAPDRIALFGVLWAVASLLHVLAVGHGGPTWAHAAVAVSAALAISWPGAVPPLVLLAASGLAAAWQEAPDLSEGWLLVALVDSGILLCAAVGAARRRAWDRVDLAERLFPAARLSLLAFSAFSGFAKLNDAYLDRRVSCAVARFAGTTGTLGLESLQGTAWLERAVIVGTIAVELTVPVLLVLRRTRVAGVLVAVGFHALVGVDRDLALWEESAVVLALASLFLPQAGPWAAERVGSIRARLALRGPRLPLWPRLLLSAGPALVALAVATARISTDGARDLGWWVWHACLVVVAVALVRLLRQAPTASRARLLPHHPTFALLPLAVVAVGLAPYLELRTAGSWTSWSNLRTVGGETNHLLVGSSASLSGSDADVVRIVDTDDPVLARYRSRAVGLTWRQLREYTSAHPDVALTYVRDGRRVAVAEARERPELVEPVPEWQAKLLPFKPVDLIEPERCLTDPGPR